MQPVHSPDKIPNSSLDRGGTVGCQVEDCCWGGKDNGTSGCRTNTPSQKTSVELLNELPISDVTREVRDSSEMPIAALSVVRLDVLAHKERGVQDILRH